MFAWMATVALAGAPEGVDVQAVEVWQERAVRMRKGPAACWRLKGRARIDFAVYRPGGLFSSPSKKDYVYEGDIAGTLDDGSWTDIVVEFEPISQAAKDNDEVEDSDVDFHIPFYPLVGRLKDREASEDPEGSAGQVSTSQAVSMVDRILDEIDADVTSTWSSWSDELGSVELYESYPLEEGSKRAVELVTRFPGGSPVGRSLDITFPKRHKVPVEGAPVRITLLRPQAHVRSQDVDGQPVPVYESMSLAAGALGFTVGFEQKVTYTEATACGSSEGP